MGQKVSSGINKSQASDIVLEQRIGKFPFPKIIDEKMEEDERLRVSEGLRDLLGNGETVSTRVTAS